MDCIKVGMEGETLRIIFLKDELVFNTTSFLLEFLQKTICSSGAPRIILDLANVGHIDSSAVGMFIMLKNGMQKAGKELYLDGVCDNVLQVLKFLDIAEFLKPNAA